MQIVVLPEVIEQKLKIEERKEVIDFINNLVADASEGLKKDIIEILEERFEKKLSVGLVTLKLELSESITASENRLNERINKVETQLIKTEAQLNERITASHEKLRVEIANSKAETIKWMFIFWMANVITIVGGVLGILKIAKVF